MSTLLQKKLAQAVVKNLKAKNPLNKKELVVSSGYAEISAKSSANIILEQKGVQEELIKYGFDPERAKEIVGSILENGENDTVKLKAADMIFKVHSTYAPEKRVNLNINETRDSKLDAIVERIENELDSEFTEGTTESA